MFRNIEITIYLIISYRKFLIISGSDQFNEEEIIRKNFDNLDITFTSEKKIKDIIPHLMKCEFCVGNDTGFAHLSINLNIDTFIIYGDCPPQLYSDLIHPIDIENNIDVSYHKVASAMLTDKEFLQKLNDLCNARWLKKAYFPWYLGQYTP